MKTLSVVAVALAIAVGAAVGLSAQAKPDQKPESKPAVNVAGKWTMTLDMSMGTATPTLDLKQDGAKITGTYTGRYGTFNLEGTMKERAIQFAFTMTAEGEAVDMKFAGEVAEDGQTITKGIAVLGELGDATWTAKKEKKEK